MSVDPRSRSFFLPLLAGSAFLLVALLLLLLIAVVPSVWDGNLCGPYTRIPLLQKWKLDREARQLAEELKHVPAPGGAFGR